VPIYFRAAELIVLPYRDILNSGTALLSLSFNRPVLVPDRGAMKELREKVGRKWVRTFVGEINARELEQALTWVTQISRPSEPYLGDLEWPKLAEQTLHAYQEVIAKRAQTSVHDSSNSYILKTSLDEAFHTERR
jgi:beta-1,4-mannosyltransferase